MKIIEPPQIYQTYSPEELKVMRSTVPRNAEELHQWVFFFLGVWIPKVRVCHHKRHCSPMEAFAYAFFAIDSMSIWYASRGFGGKCVRASETFINSSGERQSWGSLVEGLSKFNPQNFSITAPSSSTVSGPVVWKAAIASDNGPREVLDFTLDSGVTISRTLEHPIYVARKVQPKRKTAVEVVVAGMTHAQDIRVGDMFLCPSQMPAPTFLCERPAHEVSLLGLLLADGSCTQSTVSFSGVDPDTRRWCREDVKALQGLAHQTPDGRQLQLSYGCGKGSRDKALTPLYVFLKDAGLLGVASSAKKFPSWVWQLPNKQLALLVGRLWSTDGWIGVERKSNKCCVVFEVTSKQLRDDMAQAMHRLGIPGYLTGPHKTSYKDSSGKKVGCQDSYAWTPYAFALTDFCFATMPHLSQKCFFSCLEILHRRSSAAWSQGWRTRSAPDGYFWQVVEKIEQFSDVPTVSVEVPDGNIFCSPFVEHNSMMLALLALTKAIILGVAVKVLGGSGEQSRRVTAYFEGTDPGVKNKFWAAPYAPREMRVSPGQRDTHLTNSGWINCLAASQTSIRGAHPQVLLIDEADELSLRHFDAAMGQTMSTDPNVPPAQTVISSTWQNPNGTFTAIMERAKKVGFPVFEWCHEETSHQPGGWLPKSEIARKRREVSTTMWEIEYDLCQPLGQERVIDSEAVKWMFDEDEGCFSGIPEDGEEVDHPVQYFFEEADETSDYYHGTDWAQTIDWTVVISGRRARPNSGEDYDRFIAYSRMGRKPWPEMIALRDSQCKVYGGPAAHDATGIGTVIKDYVDYPSYPFVMSGAQRARLFSQYIQAIEHNKIKMPRIEWMYKEHLTCTRADLYGAGHPPDSIVAGALAWFARSGPIAKTGSVQPEPYYAGHAKNQRLRTEQFTEKELKSFGQRGIWNP